MATVF